MAAVAIVLTIPLYLITPRSSFQKLEFGRPRVEIGFAADQMVDLTQTGSLRANDRVAFEVVAEAEFGRKFDLSPEQRWRGAVRGRYQSGRWPESTDFRLPAVAPGAVMDTLGSLPRLWTDQIVLTFENPPGGRGRFLADPIRWVGGAPAPVFSERQAGFRTWVWGGNGSFIPDGRQRSANNIIRYYQLWRPGADEDLSTPFLLIDHDLPSVLHPLRQNPVHRVKQYADALIEGMVSDGRLPADPFDRVSMLPRREFHDTIARAFSAHLATTPTLTYTTDLRRERTDVDPVEDFLFHSRSGHCERFASALVLMLRSQGIPSVLVLGFKGCEPTDEPGRYIVRQSHAHAWVEALIEDFQPRSWWEVARPSRWRTLDPTPSGGSADDAGAGWMDRSASRLRRLYNTYVVDYSAEQRMRAIVGAIQAVARRDVLAGLGLLVAVVLLVRAVVRRRRIAAESTGERHWFDRLLSVLSSHGLTLGPGETAREFALRAAEYLQRHPATAAVAEVPLAWAEAYYETRFGGQAPSESRWTELDGSLDELRAALGQRGRRDGDST